MASEVHQRVHYILHKLTGEQQKLQVLLALQTQLSSAAHKNTKEMHKQKSK